MESKTEASFMSAPSLPSGVLCLTPTTSSALPSLLLAHHGAEVALHHMLLPSCSSAQAPGSKQTLHSYCV